MQEKKKFRGIITGTICVADFSSTNIAGINYDYTMQALTVRFIKGMSYTYQPITLMEFNALAISKSKGKHFAQHIKSKPYIRKEAWKPYEQVQDLQNAATYSPGTEAQHPPTSTQDKPFKLKCPKCMTEPCKCTKQ